MDDEMTRKRPGGTRFLKIALGLSLALNLAVAGVVVGALARPDGPVFKGARAPGAATFGAPYMRALSKDQRRTIAGEIRAELRDAVPDRHYRRQLFEDVLQGLKADPFDPKVLTAATQRQAETAVAVQQAAQRAWIEMVSQMSPKERQEYADAVETSLRKRHDKRD